jgi:glycosyltransferase involved in cell wall biosynthesis
MSDSAPPHISAVIPVHNEELNIPELHERLSKVLEELCAADGVARDNFEIVLVDDGSRDTSWSKIEEIHGRDPRLKGVRLARCFGHHIAMTAGIDRARGSAVILMDGDLQDIPEELPKVYGRYKEGFDLVYALRQERQDPLIKRINSSLFWWVINKMSGLHMPRNQTMMRVMSRRLVDAFKEMREYGRFIHGMMAWTGFDVSEVYVAHGRREHGKTKYSIYKQLRLAVYAITAFSVTPLRVASILGLVTALASFAAAVYLVALRFLVGYPVIGWASIIVSIFFVGGVQLLVLGIIGEYLGKTYQEVQRRPLYVTRAVLR